MLQLLTRLQLFESVVRGKGGNIALIVCLSLATNRSASEEVLGPSTHYQRLEAGQLKRNPNASRAHANRKSKAARVQDKSGKERE